VRDASRKLQLCGLASSPLPDWTWYRQLGYFLKLLAAKEWTLATREAHWQLLLELLAAAL